MLREENAIRSDSMALPAAYGKLPLEELNSRIGERKRALADDLLILGHHYQGDDVISWADVRGDSFELAKKAAATDKRFIVFCGVHFMAESADMLTAAHQRVQLPDLEAGCPMADMASAGEVESAWAQLGRLMPVDERVVPLTYINSSAAVKGFCGRHGGIVCTSANAAAIMRWGLRRAPMLFFMPDQHLGRNTALAAGIPADEIVVWQPHLPLGGLEAAQIQKARVILWNGHCHVHTRFTVDAVRRARETYSAARIVVHPECSQEVVAVSDEATSTSGIIRVVEQAGAGATIVVGTEINLVQRLARQFPDRTVVPLESSLCPNMYKVGLADLLYVLDHPGEAHVVSVAPEIAGPARLALERMLEVAANQDKERTL
jgi:quinolinate synthase